MNVARAVLLLKHLQGVSRHRQSTELVFISNFFLKVLNLRFELSSVNLASFTTKVYMSRKVLMGSNQLTKISISQ